jgi:hypothetical protein
MRKTWKRKTKEKREGEGEEEGNGKRITSDLFRKKTAVPCVPHQTYVPGIAQLALPHFPTHWQTPEFHTFFVYRRPISLLE